MLFARHAAELAGSRAGACGSPTSATRAPLVAWRTADGRHRQRRRRRRAGAELVGPTLEDGYLLLLEDRACRWPDARSARVEARAPAAPSVRARRARAGGRRDRRRRAPRAASCRRFLLMGARRAAARAGDVRGREPRRAAQPPRRQPRSCSTRCPQGARTRTAAQLLAVLAVVPLAAALLAAAYLLFDAGDGLVVGARGTRRMPALVELLQGPLLVVALGAVGVLLGRIAPVRCWRCCSPSQSSSPRCRSPPGRRTRRCAGPCRSPTTSTSIRTAGVPARRTRSRMCSPILGFDVAGMTWHLFSTSSRWPRRPQPSPC